MTRISTALNNFFSGRFYTIYLPVLVMFSVTAIFYRLVFLYNVNVPCSDDHGIALLFMNAYVDQATFLDKLRVLFSQHGEHRLMWPHLIILLDYYIEGHVNFYTFGIIGNLALAGLLMVFYQSMGDREYKILFFAPLVPLILQLQHWEIIPFPTAAIQNFHVVFLALLTLYLLDKKSTALVALGFVTFFLTVFSSGSGMMVFLPGLIVLLVQKRY
ncbi:MAG TPA: hypothetical protein VG737_13700, partial [Cyclobacteriaceae bacterium]|nr:hypothetical protein [Cyclobacteriaceae bacterium]